MEVEFRIPGREYAYAAVKIEGANPFDVIRTVSDMGGDFWVTVGNALEQGCASVALGVLQPHVIEETGPAWDDAASAPQWASQPPQEQQNYQSAPQAYAPAPAQQQPYQAPQGAYQTQVVPGQPNNPPGLTPPGVCARHGQPAKYKPAGTNRTTNRPYNAFWTCPAGDFDCTKASNFPKP